MNLPAPGVNLAPGGVACLVGDWTLARLLPAEASLAVALAAAAGAPGWDLSQVARLDSYGAALLWRSWGRRLPPGLILPPALAPSFEALARLPAEGVRAPCIRYRPGDGIRQLGVWVLGLLHHIHGVITLLGLLSLEMLQLLRGRSPWPWREFSANLYKSGVMAMPVVALVGFLIGVVLSYLSALQLRAFGADTFIVNILGLGIIRELGPILVAVLVAGRSGSAMTAQLGVMRVTEEIDALLTMGISPYLRLVLPKVLALSVALPLLTLWCSSLAILGGMVSARLQLDMSFHYFLSALPRSVPLANLLIGLGKGAVFGGLIALLACHFGLRVKPNTESLSANTTTSVVSAITVVILVDAIFAIATRSLGLPR